MALAAVVTNMSKTIYKDGKVDYERWQAPKVGAAVHNATTKTISAPTAKQLSGIQRQAYDEGLQAGRQEGIKQGMVQGVAQFKAQLDSLDQAMRGVDDVIVDELSQLAVTIAKQLLRRELKSDPGEIVALVREALSLLVSTDRKITVYLHPEDVLLVREALANPESESNWRLVDDPSLTRGGCKLRTEVSHIDASVETRIAEVAARILGGERADDE